jgi:hypothetical protein
MEMMSNGSSVSEFRSFEDVVMSTMRIPSEEYLRLGAEFGKYHKDPVNVFLHFVTTPMGLVGAISLLRRITNSSSIVMSLIAVYLLSLLPVVPNGDFYGTGFLCIVVVLIARQLKLGFLASLGVLGIGYLLQDLSHLGTGELTFQSTYSAGGHVSNLTTNFTKLISTLHGTV